MLTATDKIGRGPFFVSFGHRIVIASVWPIITIRIHRQKKLDPVPSLLGARSRLRWRNTTTLGFLNGEVAIEMDLHAHLKDLKAKVALLRVAEVIGGASNKLPKIRVVRLQIAQALTVISLKHKSALANVLETLNYSFNLSDKQATSELQSFLNFEVCNLLSVPTLVLRVCSRKDMVITQNEIFGPVAALLRLKTEDEVVEFANDTNAGLVAYVYISNMQRSWWVTESLEYGVIGVNDGLVSSGVVPFGGYKQSGLGREGSKYAIDDFVEDDKDTRSKDSASLTNKYLDDIGVETVIISNWRMKGRSKL